MHGFTGRQIALKLRAIYLTQDVNHHCNYKPIMQLRCFIGDEIMSCRVCEPQFDSLTERRVNFDNTGISMYQNVPYRPTLREGKEENEGRKLKTRGRIFKRKVKVEGRA